MMIFDPRLIFACLWGAEILAQNVFGGIFGEFALDTWLSVVTAISAFMIGATFIDLKVTNDKLAQSIFVSKVNYFFRQEISHQFIQVCLILMVIIVAINFQQLLHVAAIDRFTLRPAECLRLQVVMDLISSREIALLLKVFILALAVCIFFISKANRLPKYQTYLIMLMGVFCALATTGRLALLLFFSSVTFLLYVQKIWSFKHILFSLFSFVLIFFLVAILLNKQTANWDVNVHPCTKLNVPATVKIIEEKQTAQIAPMSLREKLEWNAQNYLLNSLAAFNHFVVTKEPVIEGGASLPNVVRVALNGAGLTQLEMRPPINPYVKTPLESNTYTAIYPIYHDLGKLGVAFYFLLLGIVHQLFFKLSQLEDKGIFKYFYAISLYPLCMVLFEEAYISSLGFWFIFIITPVLIQGLNLLFLGLKRSLNNV